MTKRTPEQDRATLIDILKNSLSYEELPLDALQFLANYLGNPAASSKVGFLLRETIRLHDLDWLGGHYEHVGHVAKED